MKELSIEEKAKRYDEVINRMKHYVVDEYGCSRIKVVDVFPELKEESEDEKIRKWIIDKLNDSLHSIESLYDRDYDSLRKAIAWLEKQGKVPVTIDIDKMVENYANNNERDNEEFGKPVNCMIRAYRLGITDTLSILNLEKQGEQKPAEWSEEDLPEFESYLCLMFQKFRTKGICTNGEIIDYVKEHSQKLKDTLCHAWSEEDEMMALGIEQLCNCASLLNISPDKVNKVKQWLKSFKERVQPQQQWKPSEEQMITLRHVISGCSYDIEPLVEIETKLKEL